MAMDVGGAKGGVKSDINVTPLVDVMLVLLIIMMIVAPLLQKGADVRLPLAANTAEKPETQDQTVVAVDRSDRYFVNGLPVRKEDLRTKVEEILETKKERIVLIGEPIPRSGVHRWTPMRGVSGRHDPGSDRASARLRRI